MHPKRDPRTAFPDLRLASGSMQAWTVMGNVIYDIMPDSAINPFVGAGIGIAHIKADQILGQFSN